MCILYSTISLEMPVPSQGHYGFHSFPVVDWFCLFIHLWVLTFPLLDCSEFGNFVITLILYPHNKSVQHIRQTQQIAVHIDHITVSSRILFHNRIIMHLFNSSCLTCCACKAPHFVILQLELVLNFDFYLLLFPSTARKKLSYFNT
jgi:hypothetical protein